MSVNGDERLEASGNETEAPQEHRAQTAKEESPSNQDEDANGKQGSDAEEVCMPQKIMAR